MKSETIEKTMANAMGVEMDNQKQIFFYYFEGKKKILHNCLFIWKIKYVCRESKPAIINKIADLRSFDRQTICKKIFNTKPRQQVI